jgi:hypothetical protein
MADDGGFVELTEDIPVVGVLGKIGNACYYMCAGLVLFPVSLCVLGGNERNSVCEGKNIDYAELNAKQLPCTSAGVTDVFGFFACQIQDKSLAAFDSCKFGSVCNGDTNLVSFKSVSGSQTVEMAQCVETVTEKDKKRTYSYKLDWSSSQVSATSFKSSIAAKNSCPGFVSGNPPWPEGLSPGTTTKFADAPVFVGEPKAPFLLNEGLVKQLTPDTVVPPTGLGNFTATDTARTGPITVTKHNTIFSNGFVQTCSSISLGCVRIKFQKSKAIAPSVLAHVGEKGAVSPQKEPASWLCSAAENQWINKNTLSFSEFIDALRALAALKTWIIRLVGIVCAWFSVYCIFSPVTTAADVVGDFVSYLPCVGEFLEDLLEGIVTSFVCLLSCGIGCGCGVLVIAVVWLAMRPLYGSLFMIFACCCCAGGVYLTKMMKGEGTGKSRRRRQEADAENE